jgi:hypothetical protein
MGACESPLGAPTTSAVGDLTGPAQFILCQNYPNPFNPSTTIRYSLPVRSHVTLTVYNSLGQQVATLFQGQQTAGRHETVFDASGLASGVYLCRIQAVPLDVANSQDAGGARDGFVQTRKLLLVR